MRNLFWIVWVIGIVIMILWSFNLHPKNITTYELMVDFGNDWTFIHDIFLSKEKCDKRLNELKEEMKNDKVKFSCIKRG